EGHAVAGKVIATESLESLAKLERAQVEGRIVLFTRAMQRQTAEEGPRPAQRAAGEGTGYGPTVSIRTSGASAAAKLGAIGVMIRSVGTGNARIVHTGAMHYDADVPKVPAVAISAEDEEMLSRLLARGDEVAVSLELGCQTLADVESANVVADFK